METTFESYQLIEFNSLFEIPIYRLSPASFEQELQQELDRICTPLSVFESLFPKNAADKYASHRREMELHIAYPWKFNEIVGWVLLNIDGNLFAGELFLKEAKRITKGSRSRVMYAGEAFRFEVDHHMTDYDIYKQIVSELTGMTKKPKIRNRFIDTNRFQTVGQYICWKKLFTDLSS